MKTTHSSSEEIDLTTVFHFIRRKYHQFLVWLFKGLQSLISIWWLVLIVLGLGFGFGYYLDAQKAKTNKANLIVQVNFEATNYVYQAIEQLNAKIVDKDLDFLKRNGFITDHKKVINHVTITPIVNLNDIFADNRYRVEPDFMQMIFDASDFQKNILTSPVLIQKYKKHNILINTPLKNESAVVNALLSYLNNNALLNKIKAVTVENMKTTLAKNNYSLQVIDSIITRYASTNSSKNAEQLFLNFNSSAEGGIYGLFQEKSALLNDNKYLNIELLKSDQIVELLNTPELYRNNTLLKKNKFVMPIVFFIGLILLCGIRHLYHKAKRLAEAGQ